MEFGLYDSTNFVPNLNFNLNRFQPRLNWLLLFHIGVGMLWGSGACAPSTSNNFSVNLELHEV